MRSDLWGDIDQAGVVLHRRVQRERRDDHAAALDVLADESPAPNNRLVHHARVLVTPHSAWYSDAAAIELRTRGIGAVVDVLSGRRPADLVAELQ